MSKELKIVFVLTILGSLMLIGSFAYATYEMLKDHREIARCKNLPINEFFRDENCEKYLEVLQNDWHD